MTQQPPTWSASSKEFLFLPNQHCPHLLCISTAITHFLKPERRGTILHFLLPPTFSPPADSVSPMPKSVPNTSLLSSLLLPLSLTCANTQIPNSLTSTHTSFQTVLHTWSIKMWVRPRQSAYILRRLPSVLGSFQTPPPQQLTRPFSWQGRIRASHHLPCCFLSSLSCFRDTALCQFPQLAKLCLIVPS